MAILDSFGFGDPWHCLFSLFLFKGKKDLSALVCYLDPADAVDLCVQKAMADFAFGRHSVGFLYSRDLFSVPQSRKEKHYFNTSMHIKESAYDIII